MLQCLDPALGGKMSRVTYSCLLALLLAAAHAASTDPAPPTTASPARTILDAWRLAVHASENQEYQTAHAKYSANENGVPGAVEQRVTPGGLFRRSTMRQFDHDEILVT